MRPSSILYIGSCLLFGGAVAMEIIENRRIIRQHARTQEEIWAEANGKTESVIVDNGADTRR